MIQQVQIEQLFAPKACDIAYTQEEQLKISIIFRMDRHTRRRIGKNLS